ncbi:zinc finger, CCHC-type containing protein, partial [Tanacetum coccineum]
MQLTLVAYLLPYLFTSWSDLQQLRIVLSVEDKLDYLEQPIPLAPVPAQAGVKNSICSTSRARASSDCKRLSLLQTRRRAVCHWKRNCPRYLAELLKNKKLSQGGLRGSGNGQRAAVEAIGIYHLCLPRRLVIVLNNCHYAPSITRGIILVSHLYDDGYVNHFVDNTISVSRNNMVYFSAIPRDGIFEIDLSNSNKNDSSMYVVSNKRAKLNLDSTLLWHCCLGHISKKRIEMLQHDGLLNSTDLKAFEKCVSCMSEKMTRKPYTHQVE